MRSTHLLRSTSLAALLIAAPHAVTAQTVDDAPADTAPADVIVSGGLTPVPAGSFARANTVITAEQIEQRNPRTLAELLRAVPGIAVARTGGPGGVTEIRLRGGEANQVLVLIDGIEQANSSAGANLGTLRPEQIERIEIVRGPQAALFGSGATAGTINIVTKGGRPGRFLTAEVEGGTAPSGAVSLLAEGGTARARGAAGISFVSDNGWDSSGDGGEEDGLEALTVNLRGDADVTSFITARGTLRYSDQTSEFDNVDGNFGCGVPGCYVNDVSGFEMDFSDLQTSLALDIDTLGGALVHTPSVSFVTSETETRDGSAPDVTDADAFEAGYQAAYTFGAVQNYTLSGAIQYRRERFDSSNFVAGGTRQREELSYVADLQAQLTDALFVQGALRWEDSDTFEDFLSFSLSGSYTIFETGTRLRASVGRAQTDPGFTEQFGFSGTNVPNPDLKPEQNFGFDLGIDQAFFDDRLTLGLTYFNETLTDEIASDFSGFPTITLTNIDGDSDRQGIEVTAAARPLPTLTLNAAYTYLDASDGSGNVEARRPEHSASLGVLYDLFDGRAQIGADLFYVAETTVRDFEDNTTPLIALDGYLLVDFSARYALSDTVEVFGSVKNVLDQDYEQALGYAEQPVTGFLGLRARF